MISEKVVIIAFAVLFIMVLASSIYAIEWRDKHKDDF